MGVLHTYLVEFTLHVGDAGGFDLKVRLELLDQTLVVLDQGGILHEICQLQDARLLILRNVLSQFVFQGFLWSGVGRGVQIVETGQLPLKKLDY